jgi:vacuolar protein sorting-associated protein 8
VEMVQQLTAALPSSSLKTPSTSEIEVLDTLRGLIQETFTTLVSQCSSPSLSFPRLFERLVDATSRSRSVSQGYYTEFRLILTGMLESYSFEGEFLTLSNRMVAQDLFDGISAVTKARQQGWRPKVAACSRCLRRLHDAPSQGTSTEAGDDSNKMAILKSGLMYHLRCLPTMM